MRIGLFTRRAQALIGALLAAVAAVTPVGAFAGSGAASGAGSGAASGAAGRYYERSFILAANDRCRMFGPNLTAALRSATWQARSAALRSGDDERALAQAAARAQARAASAPCDSADLKTVEGRVRSAFDAWFRTPRMVFPGQRAAWTADRASYNRPSWSLLQGAATGLTPVRFGMAGALSQPEQLTAVVSWHGRSRPTAARIVMRDAAVAPRPWLARELPPPAQRRAVWAMGVAPAQAELLVKGRTEGQAWTFPTTAAQVLTRLDPREVFAVEFVFRDGSVAQVQFEVGDMAAALAFLTMGRD